MKKQTNYMESVYRSGRIWGLIVAALIIAVPFIIAVVFSAVPKWDALAKGLIATLPMYWAVGFIEIITYVPMLGAGGTYLSFVTGNISNLKLPCAVDAMERANVKASSEEGEVICAGGLEFTVLETPGHTWGSVCYLCEDALFSGDTLFAGSCGRTDLPGGDYQTILLSLERLAELPGDRTVYSGHGDITTLEKERKRNPYMRNAL